MPEYPVVKQSPTVDDCYRAMRFSDYFQWAGVTAASWGYGFIRGKPARFGMAGLMAGIGFTFGSFVVLQNTRGRLMGFRENAKEVTKFGKETEAALDNAQVVKPSMQWKSYN